MKSFLVFAYLNTFTETWGIPQFPGNFPPPPSNGNWNSGPSDGWFPPPPLNQDQSSRTVIQGAPQPPPNGNPNPGSGDNGTPAPPPGTGSGNSGTPPPANDTPNQGSGNQGSGDNGTPPPQDTPKPGSGSGNCKEKKNMILMISDGFGPASETMTRQYYQSALNAEMKLDRHESFRLDKQLVGSSRTHSANNWITDSAAGATAYSCALKSYNGAIGVDSDKRPCATVLEAAKEMGYMTGLVATSRVTHATPAAFSAHVPKRSHEADIALHQLGEYELGRQLDLLMGGGRKYFVTKKDDGKRKDGRNLLEEAPKFGWKTVAQNLQEFQALDSSSLPLIAVLARSHMSYEIDREDDQPSLKDMTEKAIEILHGATKDDCESPGFFMMIEGSRIDHAAHVNDISTHFREVVAYHAAVNHVLDWVEQNKNTMGVSVSDHETGGLTMGITPQVRDGFTVEQVDDWPYQWFPGNITRAKHSASWLEDELDDALDKGGDPATEIKRLIAENYGINDPQEKEVQAIIDAREISSKWVKWGFASLLSTRGEAGWSTHGHTAIDVNLYGWGNVIPSLKGSLDNTQVGKSIMEYLSINDDQLAKISAKLAGSMSFASVDVADAAEESDEDDEEYH